MSKGKKTAKALRKKVALKSIFEFEVLEIYSKKLEKENSNLMLKIDILESKHKAETEVLILHNQNLTNPLLDKAYDDLKHYKNKYDELTLTYEKTDKLYKKLIHKSVDEYISANGVKRLTAVEAVLSSLGLVSFIDVENFGDNLTDDENRTARVVTLQKIRGLR